MANPQHVERLEQGVSSWNRWRSEQPDVRPDLSHALLAKASLAGIDFGGVNLHGARLAEADLSRANLAGADLAECDLRDADLPEADLTEADLTQAGLSQARLFRADLSRTKLFNANLSRAAAKEACFAGANLVRTKLIGVNLQSAVLHGATLVQANLHQANLQEAVLTGADLYQAGLAHADLRGADLSGARLVECGLQHGNFLRCIVSGKTLLWDCKLDEGTDFTGVGLGNVRIQPGLRSDLECNIRKIRWRAWYGEHRLLQYVFRPFWNMSNYGTSTGRILGVFTVLTLLFAVMYLLPWMLTPGDAETAHPLVTNLERADGLEVPSAVVPLRALYFSVVTMTTLGFGDIHAHPQSALGHVLLMIQVLLGYILLGALITRLSIAFQSTG